MPPLAHTFRRIPASCLAAPLRHDHLHRPLIRSRRFKVVEVGCGSIRVQREIIAVRVGAGGHAFQTSRAIRPDVYRLRDNSIRLQETTPIVTHSPRPKREVENDISFFAYEIKQSTAEMVLHIAMCILKQRHMSDTAIPRLLVKRKPDHAIRLETARRGRLPRTCGAAHEDNSHHAPHSNIKRLIPSDHQRAISPDSTTDLRTLSRVRRLRYRADVSVLRSGMNSEAELDCVASVEHPRAPGIASRPSGRSAPGCPVRGYG